MYCTGLLQACDSFSRKIYVICPAEANPVERVAGPALLKEKISVVYHPSRAATNGRTRFSHLVADFLDLRSHVAAIQHTHPGEKLFIYHTSLDSFLTGPSILPRLLFSINKLLPWEFSGMLMAPDRIWPLHKARQSLDELFGDCGPSISVCSLIKLGLERVLDGMGAIFRGVYLCTRNLVLRRSRCNKIAVLDERYAEWLHRRTGKQIVAYPEMTLVATSEPPPELVRMIDSRREGRVVVGVLGALHRRKGVGLLIDMIKEEDTCDFLFVLAGACSFGSFLPQHRAFLEREIHRRDNIIFLPQAVTLESDFNAIVAACDVVYGVYRDHLHSSGLLSKAAAFGKPLLVSEGALMAKRVRDYGIGRVVPIQTPQACLKMLKEMGTPECREFFATTTNFRKYIEAHSSESLQRVMEELGTSRVKPGS
jgi:glycosyltransferase involved in cell wall biosynthesis